MASITLHEAVMEYAVKMTSRDDELLVRSKLENIRGVKEFKIDLEEKTVLVTTELSSFEIQQLLESTGFLVILRGYSHSTSDIPIEGGVVTMLRDSKVCGLCRMLQGSVTCVIEGSLSGLEEGVHRVEVHSGGDVTRGADSCGGVYGTDSNGAKGYLGNFKVGRDGAINFRFDTNQFKVCDVIGRSLITTHYETGTNTYGIIARSSGVFGNRKKVCQCSGETIWEEAIRAREETIRSSL